LGDNTDIDLNFIPKMRPEALVEGYRKVLNNIYSPKDYYRRVLIFLKDYRPPKRKGPFFKPGYLRGLVSSMFLLGIIGKERLYYWKLFFWTLFKKPQSFPLAITLSIYGFHFRKVAEKINWKHLTLQFGNPENPS
jgi:hypothetical protein